MSASSWRGSSVEDRPPSCNPRGDDARVVTTVPAVDGPELTPAMRKRPPSDVRPVEPVAAAPTAGGDDGLRLASLETAVRAIDVRLEYLERLVSSGFQEAASRSVVLAEASDELVTGVDERLAALQQRVDELAEAVLALAPTIEAILDLRSDVTLVGERLGELLGGPSLTEIMDRLDEIAEERRNR
jgi:hypothetical protein